MQQRFVLPLSVPSGLWGTGPVEQHFTPRCWFTWQFSRVRLSPCLRGQHWNNTRKTSNRSYPLTGNAVVAEIYQSTTVGVLNTMSICSCGAWWVCRVRDSNVTCLCQFGSAIRANWATRLEWYLLVSVWGRRDKLSCTLWSFYFMLFIFANFGQNTSSSQVFCWHVAASWWERVEESTLQCCILAMTWTWKKKNMFSQQPIKWHEPLTVLWSLLFTDDVLVELETVGGQPMQEVYYSLTTNTEDFFEIMLSDSKHTALQWKQEPNKASWQWKHSHTRSWLSTVRQSL